MFVCFRERELKRGRERIFMFHERPFVHTKVAISVTERQTPETKLQEHHVDSKDSLLIVLSTSVPDVRQ